MLLMLHNFINSRIDVDTYFNIPFITCETVVDYMNALSDKKTTCFDNVSAKLIRSFAPDLIQPMTEIINASIKACIFPDPWKVARVVPLFKGRSKKILTIIDQYQVYVFCQSIRKHISDCSKQFLDLHKIISTNQSGFRNKHSCESVLIKITDIWYSAISDGQLIGADTLDLRRAFDLVSYKVLLEKLKLYKFSDSCIKWFTSYLQNRFRFVKFDDYTSDFGNLSCGVPHGSILGPLLFILFTNDLPLFVSDCSIDMFADDTTIYYINSNPLIIQTVLQNELNIITNWCHMNKLVMNPNKTKSMIICSQQKRSRLVSDVMTLQIDSKIIESVSSSVNK